MKVGNNLDFLGNSRVLNLPAPGSANEPARLIDLSNYIEGIKHKAPVAVATQGNINLAAPGDTIDGIDLSVSENKRVLVKAQTDPEDNGIYIWNGSALPMTRSADASTAGELNSALVDVEGGTNEGTNWRQTATIVTLGTDDINWASYGTAAPPASDTTPGVIEIATQAEVNAGTASNLAVTPETLSNYTGLLRKYSTQIGDGSAVTFAVTHSLGTRLVNVSVFNTTTYEDIIVDIVRTDTNTVTINFEAGNVPTSNQYTVVVIG